VRGLAEEWQLFVVMSTHGDSSYPQFCAAGHTWPYSTA
jgi:hypothetical protein